MSTLSRRVQILLDEERYRRLEQRADERGASVAALIREAIDQTFPEHGLDRRRAAQAVLDADPMPVAEWPIMKEEMLTDRYGRIGS